MAQSNLVGCLPTDSTEETERQRKTGLKAEDKIRRTRDKGLSIPKGTVQSANAENPVHLEQTFEQSDDKMGSNVRSTSQRDVPGINGEFWPERTSLEVSAGAEHASHPTENTASGGREFSQLRVIILSEIREHFLRMSGAASTMDATDRSLSYKSHYPFSIMVKRNKKVDLDWSLLGERLPHKVAEALRNAWPRHWNSEGMEQIILQSDGTMPVSQVSWGSVDKDFQQQYDRLILQSFTSQERSDFKFSAYESLWHKWCLDAAESRRSSPDHADSSSSPRKFRGQIIYCNLENYKKEQHMFPLDQLTSILSYEEPFLLPPSEWSRGNTSRRLDLERLWFFLRRGFEGRFGFQISTSGDAFAELQFRYFCQPYGTRTSEAEVRYPCFLGDRQRANIGRGSAIQYLEERRARVSLHVSPLFPGLFNIFVLADDHISPSVNYWGRGPEGERTEPNWARYGLKPCGRGTAFTHFMFELSRVVEKSLNSWINALDSIDKLAHVKLSDFEDEKRVEDLMFDKSFTRSKDYFVAIQLLRIMDEWLDELLLSIEDLNSMPARIRPIFCADEAEDNIDSAIEGMKERATRFQNRVRKKAEEIKSLRDGLFNATSLREATKAMALNQAIYVFTVVTVLFTPVSFLATFWALPFLNNPAEEGSDKVPEPASFRSSFVTLPLLTYGLVIGIAWYMRPDQSRYRLPDWLAGIWDTIGEKLKSAWNSLPREIKRTRRKVQGGSDTGDSV